MTYRQTRRMALWSLLCAVLAFGSPTVSQAGPVVLSGWDLFETLPGTMFQGIPLKGVPVGTHNFAGVGVRNTFNADTIVRRLDNVTAPSGVTDLVMETLQLMTVAPVPAFGDFLFYTLQSDRGGPATVGQMTINFGPEGQPHGTFSSFFDVFFDLHLGALNGPIVFSGNQTIAGSASWGHFPPPPPPGAVLIPGVNFMLNGQDQLADFFPAGIVTELGNVGTVHAVQTATVPEPATLLFLGSGLLGLSFRLRRMRHRT